MNEPKTTRFNLSEWALNHQSFVLFVMIVLAVLGVLSYQRLGQSEDPPFTFKVMVIRSNWPGASAREVEQQLTDKIEKKLQEAPHVDVIRSYSKPGESLVFLVLKDSTPASAVPDAWYQVRKKIGDIRQSLPAGVQGPFFNDEFGDTYGNLYALAGDGFGYAALKDNAERIRDQLLRVPDVAKVDLLGVQDEKIFIELSNVRLATLGVDPNQIIATLQNQNAVSAAGAFETASDKIYLRATGEFDKLDELANLSIRANGRLFRLGDIARVYRGYADPPQPKVRYQGRDVVAIAVSMAPGGDIIELGRHLTEATQKIQSTLPVGLDLVQYSNQPSAVAKSIREFARTLTEAIVIVLAVSLFSLGLRTGIVVALSIPLVLAATFLFMAIFDVGLHKISLGALILALGLLVDDAIIAVEMMAIKMEQGWDRVRAASFTYSSTAMPMLTGTAVTVAGFLPIATAASSTGEYTRSIFQVNAIALSISWIAAVVLIPYLGYKLLPDLAARHRAKLAAQGTNVNATGINTTGTGHVDEHAVYDSAFYRGFRALVERCVRYRKSVLFITLGIFLASLVLFRFVVQQQFFPDSTRLELMVDLRLPEGSSIAAAEAQAKKLEGFLAQQDGVENYVSYVGSGSPRFYLPLDQQLTANNYAQVVVLAKGAKEREAIRAKLIELFDRDFPLIRANVTRLENGPPVGFPVQFRVAGPDIPTLRGLADEVAAVMRKNPHLQNVQFDWGEPSKAVSVAIDQNKARVLGLSTQQVAYFLNTSLNGSAITTYREGNLSIDVVLCGAVEERVQLRQLKDLAIPTGTGGNVTLEQIATISYGLEEGVIWRRNRQPNITVRANVYGGDIQPPAVTAEVEPQLAALRAKLPAGYTIETGGSVEESAKGAQSVAAGVPLFIVVVLTALMLQLHSIQRVLMVVLTAPLGIIGVALFLAVFNVPFGFVAMLGTIALSGMIMRNSVILVDQIEQDIKSGLAPWNAIVEATVRRFRPITLTAAAAVLAMIPLTRSAFFGPMAVAIMGGLIVATALTLLFLPALYAAWFRVKAPVPSAQSGEQTDKTLSSLEGAALTPHQGMAGGPGMPPDALAGH